MSPPPPRERASYEKVAELFKVFGDASRLQILHALKKGPHNVSELVNQLQMTQANVSKHLRILHETCILTRERRGTAAYYAIDDEMVFPLCDLVCGKLKRDSEKREIGFDISI